MDRFDDHSQDELRDLARRLRESRATFTPLELDEMQMRLERRMQRPAARRRGIVSRLRMSSVAGLAALGLMLTSGVGAVFAAGALGGGDSRHGVDPIHNIFQTTSFRHGRDASECQYQQPVTRTFVIHTLHGGVLIITITIFCGHIHVHITFHEHFFWRFGDRSNQNSAGDVNTDAPNDTHVIVVTIGGAKYTVPVSD
jgi:hypothetical protein